MPNLLLKTPQVGPGEASARGLRTGRQAVRIGDDSMTSAPTILLVDEEPILRHATALLLTNRGGRVSPAATLGEALVLASAQAFDVAILDVAPEGPSAAVMVELLRTRGLVPGRIVVCVPWGPREDTDFTVVLEKPYPFEHLIDAVFGAPKARRVARSGVFARVRAREGVVVRPTRRALPARRDRG
jgi:CheY-like chemotaxis protein